MGMEHCEYADHADREQFCGSAQGLNDPCAEQMVAIIALVEHTPSANSGNAYPEHDNTHRAWMYSTEGGKHVVFSHSVIKHDCVSTLKHGDG